jgi:hypothetical protein
VASEKEEEDRGEESPFYMTGEGLLMRRSRWKEKEKKYLERSEKRTVEAEADPRGG